MDSVVVVAASFLGVLFIASFIALIVLCRHKYCKRNGSTETDEYSRIVPVSSNESVLVTSFNEMELDDIITCDDNTIRQLLETEEWAFDAEGLIPHCLSILKMCREVTEKLVAMTITTSTDQIHPSELDDVVQVARRITPRVDDVMNAIQPPLDAQLLEARSAALILSVSHLALLIKNACRRKGSLEWIDQALANMEVHMKVLRGVTPNPMSSSMTDSVESSSNEIQSESEPQEASSDQGISIL